MYKNKCLNLNNVALLFLCYYFTTNYFAIYIFILSIQAPTGFLIF